MPSQQITRASKPGEERSQCYEIERRELAVVVHAMTVRNSSVHVHRPMHMEMRKVQTQPAG